MLGYYATVGLIAGTVLIVANSRPHAQVAAEGAPTGPIVQLDPQQATASFPADDVTQLRTISQDTLDLITGGDQSAATTRISDLEKAWDDAQAHLEPLDETAWTFLDSEIDAALTAVRASNPDTAEEQQALTVLVVSLTP